MNFLVLNKNKLAVIVSLILLIIAFFIAVINFDRGISDFEKGASVGQSEKLASDVGMADMPKVQGTGQPVEQQQDTAVPTRAVKEKALKKVTERQARKDSLAGCEARHSERYCERFYKELSDVTQRHLKQFEPKQ